MSLRKHISAACFVALLGLAVLVPPAWTQKKGDLYKLAETAAGLGKVEEAQKFYCQVAQIDAGYKDAKLLCAVMTQEVEKENKNNEERFKLGVKSFNEGKLDAAQHEFLNIKWGPHAKEAQDYLNVKIPQARKGAAGKQG